MKKIAVSLPIIFSLLFGQQAISKEYTMDKECIGRGFIYSVTKVVTDKDATKITLTPFPNEDSPYQFNPPGSAVTLHLVAIDEKFDKELIDIEGIRFNTRIGLNKSVVILEGVSDFV